MRDVIDGELVDVEQPKESVWNKNLLEVHWTYLSVLWQISYSISGFASFIYYIWLLFQAASDGFVSFLLTFLMSFVIIAISGLLLAIALFIFLLCLTLIPYLIFRGLVR